MRLVYGTQLELRSGSTEDDFATAKSLIRSWIEDKYRTYNDIEVEVAFDGSVLEPLPDHKIWSIDEDLGDASICRVNWASRDDRDPSIEWRAQCALAFWEDTVELAISVHVLSRTFVIQPVRVAVGRPKIVPDLVARVPCFIGRIKIDEHPVTCHAVQVDGMVETLLDRGRRIPVVVVSPDNYTDQPLVDIDRLASNLVGLAQVVELPNRFASYRLTDLLGKALSCYHGAVRIYWPGLTLKSNPYQHKLFLRHHLDRFKNLKTDAEHEIFQLIASVSSFRFAGGTTTSRVNAHRRRQREKELEILRTGAERLELARREIANQSKTKEELEEEAITALLKAEELTKDLESAETRIQELEDELAAHKDNWAVYQSSVDETSSEDADSADEIPDLESVEDALKAAGDKYGETLVAWPTAIKSAKASDYERPNEVYTALRAINELAEKYFADDSGRIGVSWEKYFEDWGFKFAPADSEATMARYGKDRQFACGKETQQMEKHLTLGRRSDYRERLQIYFQPCKIRRRMVIGYCGKHLPIVSYG